MRPFGLSKIRFLAHCGVPFKIFSRFIGRKISAFSKNEGKEACCWCLKFQSSRSIWAIGRCCWKFCNVMTTWFVETLPPILSALFIPSLKSNQVPCVKTRRRSTKNFIIIFLSTQDGSTKKKSKLASRLHWLNSGALSNKDIAFKSFPHFLALCIYARARAQKAHILQLLFLHTWA